MMYYEQIKISSINIDEGKYNDKKKKYIKYKTPKITKKVLFEDDLYDIGELYNAIKYAHDRDPYNQMEVSFKTHVEY